MEARGIEVGHIFYFGTKYSEPMKCGVAGPDGKEAPVHMGSYGIGVSRLVGAIIEASHDANGIIWPEPVAPFKVHVVNLNTSHEKCTAVCDDIYAKLQAAGVEVLYDDTEERAGSKLATADLIGMPWQIIVGPKGVEKGVVELKNRKSGEKQDVALDSAVKKMAA